MHKKELLVYIIAGEASGDLLGMRLMKALKELYRDTVSFAGIGGDFMQKEGISSLFPMQELSLMGVFEILPHLPNVLSRLNQTIDDIEKKKPDVVVTIDSPDFNFRVGKAVKKLGIPLVHYTMPSVWAWREKRAEKVARFLSKGLALLPFEPPYFTRHGLDCTFVGHPIVESEDLKIKSNTFRKRYQIPEDKTLICVLPGSRKNELKYMLPTFSKTIQEIAERHPDIAIVIPTFRHFRERIEEEAMSWGVPAVITVDPEEKYQAMQASNVALAASGTVALELALLDVPMVIGYKVNFLTALVARALIKTKYVSLVNIILQKLVVPEYLQERCLPNLMALGLDEILHEKGKTQRKAFVELRKMLSPDDEKPSMKAARAIQSLLNA
ncbi:MAG: lipid-A-disaccharide synthase [Candidatus Nucleicultricaceae bacterium]